MRSLIFIGHNQVGDAVMAYMVIDALCYYYPDVAVYCYNKNGDSVSSILTKHPNVKESGKISTKLFRKSLYRDVYLLYKKIKELLKNDDVYISSLIGSSTLYFALLPFLIWLRLTQKHKVHILQLRPKWFKYNGHLLDFHLDMLSRYLSKNIEYREKYPLFAGKKNVKIKTIVVLPGASRLWKSLSVEKFAYILDYFASKGYEVIILGSKSEIDLKQADGIVALMRNKVANLTGKTNLTEYIERIANASYVIANDSSGQHVAHICKTPVAVLWGRNANGRIAKSYSWKDNLTLNIFNELYVCCNKCSFWNKFKTEKQILANHENCEECITQNLASISNDVVIQKIEEHLRLLYI